MLKIIGSNAWEGALWTDDTPRVALIKRSSRGVMDRQAFVKRACASSDELLSKLASIEVKPGEELLHLIALGTTEAYGPNRNGDGFSKEASRKYHNTFVKNARVYRDHKNTDKSKSYGIVKASAFNEAMQRIELIVALNSTKQAAKANGGLVADKEMEKLASGKDIPVSMACSVPFDICSCCGNKATTQAEYCKSPKEGGHCKAGGLRHNMGKLVSVDGELKQLYADNTEPSFFDISHVFVPADRIAYSSGRLTKTASIGDAIDIGGAELARRMCISAPNTGSSLPALTFFKDAVSTFHNRQLWQKRASFLGVMNAKSLTDTHVPKKYKFAALQRALVDTGVCLTASQFVQLATDLPANKARTLGEVIAPLSNDAFMKMAEAYSPYGADEQAPQELYGWIRQQRLPSVFPEDMFKQAAVASITDAPEFTVSPEMVYECANDPAIMDVADGYARYKLAFVASLPTRLQEPTAELLVGRDYLSF